MSNGIFDRHARELQTKMVMVAFSPVGAPRSCERERYLVSYGGIDEIGRATSERGGENHAW